jgi:hypothetical protein
LQAAVDDVCPTCKQPRVEATESSANQIESVKMKCDQINDQVVSTSFDMVRILDEWCDDTLIPSLLEARKEALRKGTAMGAKLRADWLEAHPEFAE